MKILTISDLHGRTVWKEANVDAYDHVIFLGDYTDSSIIDNETIYTNLSEIIQLKQANPGKFILLIGNHDAQYLHFPHYRCSGFRALAQPALSTLLSENNDLFQIAYQQGAYLLTHAGVTNKWLARFLVKTGNESLVITPNYDLAGLLNSVHQQSLYVRSLLFEVGPKRGGYDPFSGPVWADRLETSVDFLTGFHQIVGHSPVENFTTMGNETSSITYTDILQTKTAFHEVIIPD